jgi:DNA-binding CsgD family transcriptional regulator
MDAIDIEKYRAAFAALKTARKNRLQELVLLLGEWENLKEAAREMGISNKTVETYKVMACKKLTKHGFPMCGISPLRRWAVEWASCRVNDDY